jgi:hypothetical protein
MRVGRNYVPFPLPADGLIKCQYCGEDLSDIESKVIHQESCQARKAYASEARLAWMKEDTLCRDAQRVA